MVEGVFIYFIYLLYFARTSYNKLQRLMDNEKNKNKKQKKNWPGDHDSKNQLPWALLQYISGQKALRISS